MYKTKTTIQYWRGFQRTTHDLTVKLGTKEEILTVVKAVAPKPLNVVMGLNSASFSLRMLEDLGVRRVSVGSLLARAAYGAFLKAAEEIKATGTFDFAADIVPYAKINGMFR